MEYISEIAQAALIVDGYFWNSTSCSHSGWIFLKQWRCKGHEKCIFETAFHICCRSGPRWLTPPYSQFDCKISAFLRLPLCFGDIKISEWNLFFLHFLHFTECIAAAAVALSVFLLFFSTAAQQMVTAKPQFYLFPFLFIFDSLLKNHIGTAGFFFAALCKVLHTGWLQTIQKSPKSPQKFLPRLEAPKESPKKWNCHCQLQDDDILHVGKLAKSTSVYIYVSGCICSKLMAGAWWHLATA